MDGMKHLKLNQLESKSNLKFKINKIKIISDLYDFLNILYF